MLLPGATLEQAADLAGADQRDMRDFETLTFVPIDKRLIVTEMLSPGERAWLDTYHADVARKLGARILDGARDWLAEATAPLAYLQAI